MCGMFGQAAGAGGNVWSSSVNANTDAQGKEIQATAEAQAAAERAARIQARGQAYLAEGRLKTLSSGVEAGSGSALETGAADAGQIQLDIMTEIYGGKSTAEALREDARLQRENSPHGIMSKAMHGVQKVIHGQPMWDALGIGEEGRNFSGLRLVEATHDGSGEAIWGFSGTGTRAPGAPKNSDPRRYG